MNTFAEMFVGEGFNFEPDQKPADVIYVAFRSVGSTQYMKDPVPARNLVREDAIQRDLAKKREEQAQHAPLLGITGVASEVILKDPKGDILLHEKGEASARKFLEFLIQRYGDRLGRELRCSCPVPFHLIGFFAKQALQVCCKQMLLSGAMKVPVRLWYNNGGLAYNIMDVILSSTEQRFLDLGGLLRACKINVDPAKVLQDPMLELTVLDQLVRRFQLFGDRI